MQVSALPNSEDCYCIILAPLKYVRSAKCVINNLLLIMWPSANLVEGELIPPESMLIDFQMFEEEGPVSTVVVWVMSTDALV